MFNIRAIQHSFQKPVRSTPPAQPNLGAINLSTPQGRLFTASLNLAGARLLDFPTNGNSQRPSAEVRATQIQGFEADVAAARADVNGLNGSSNPGFPDLDLSRFRKNSPRPLSSGGGNIVNPGLQQYTVIAGRALR